MSNYYIHLAGGLGDVLLAYFTGKSLRRGVDGGFGFLDQLKQEQPESQVQLIMHPVQKHAAHTFFKLNPKLDIKTILDWRNPCHKCPHEKKESIKNSINLMQYGTDQGWERNPNSTIYTSPQDEVLVQQVVDKGPFIIIHPFAGQQNRMPIPIKQYPLIMSSLASDFNCNIVVVGATHDRSATATRHIEEQFKYVGDHIINLVNQANIRVAARLMHLSKAAVATHSAMFCVASGGGIPIVVTARGRNLAGFARQRIQASYREPHMAKVIATDTTTTPTANIRRITRCLNKLISES